MFLDIINYTREYFRQVIGIQGVFVNWKTHIGKFELMTKITDSKIIGSFKRGCVAPAEVNPYEVFKTYKKRIYFSVHVRYFFMKPQKYRINHMRPNRIYITGILLLFAFLSGRAQQPRIDELECRNLKIGYEKTLHMIFPTPVKYLNMGDENIIGEVIQVCPSVIRLKSTVRDFKGETNLSVVTEDSRYYTYCISFDEGAQAVYKEGGTMPETAVLPVSDEKLTHVIYPEKIVYVDFGNTTVQVEKAENVNNIVALRAVSPFALQTNLTAITESGRFYTFDLRYAPGCERFSFIVDKQDTKKKQVAILDEYDYNFYEGIDRRQMKELRELVWLREAYNLILMGPSGTGKTFLAAGLVFDAVKAGYKAYLMTMEDIVNCLRLKDISTPAMMTYNKILRAQLLAIDDIMLFPVKREEATAFFNLVNTLHEKTSIIITTNKAPTEWVETLNDEILASALLDRLLYRCEVIKFTGSSYRLENRQTIFKTTTGTRNELMKP